jgi:predicted nucleotidyltransferase
MTSPLTDTHPDAEHIQIELYRRKQKMVTNVSMKPLGTILADLTHRITQVSNPQRIILFGSSVTGKMNKDSDLDILVIMRGPVHRRQLAQKIYRNLHGVSLPVDIIVATEEDISGSSKKTGSILRPAMAEGQIIYDAQG